MLHPKIPMYLREVSFSTEKKDGETRKICALSLVIAPFSSAMAEELGTGIREHIFKRTDGEPLDQLSKAEFKIVVGSLQEMRIQLAPDSPAGNVIVIPNCRVSPILKVRRDKETPTIEAKLSLDFPYPVAEVLLFMANQQNEQIIVSLNNEQLNMLDEQRSGDAAEKPRLGRPKKQPPLAPVDDGAPMPEGPAATT